MITLVLQNHPEFEARGGFSKAESFAVGLSSLVEATLSESQSAECAPADRITVGYCPGVARCRGNEIPGLLLQDPEVAPGLRMAVAKRSRKRLLAARAVTKFVEHDPKCQRRSSGDA